ncbi:hypothetical protein KEM52_002140 [Ascosphaera acerosa]|nr:hypothetical protein KEM52_002140 [Ascosphaera acerosa]
MSNTSSRRPDSTGRLPTSAAPPADKPKTLILYNNPDVVTWEDFRAWLLRTFGGSPAAAPKRARLALVNLTVGPQELTNASIAYFEALAAKAGFNKAALVTQFQAKLHADLYQEINITTHGQWSETLCEWKNLAIAAKDFLNDNCNDPRLL